MQRVLLLGAGKIGRMISRMLLDSGDYAVVVGDVSADALELIAHRVPGIEVRQVEIHKNVAILETADAGMLLELAANPKIRRYLLGRLSDTAALIDPGSDGALTKAIRAEGNTPKVVKGTTA